MPVVGAVSHRSHDMGKINPIYHNIRFCFSQATYTVMSTLASPPSTLIW